MLKPYMPTPVLVMGAVICIGLPLYVLALFLVPGGASKSGEVRISTMVTAVDFEHRSPRIEVLLPGGDHHWTPHFNGHPKVGDTLEMTHPADAIDPLVQVGFHEPKGFVWLMILALLGGLAMGGGCLWVLVKRLQARSTA
jgi:hypothetical protein